MDKKNFESPDITQANIARLAKLFPSAPCGPTNRISMILISLFIYAGGMNAAEPAALACCFEASIGTEVITEIARRQPLRTVFRDAGFADSQDKINALELFKNFAPDTEVKVI